MSNNGRLGLVLFLTLIIAAGMWINVSPSFAQSTKHFPETGLYQKQRITYNVSGMVLGPPKDGVAYVDYLLDPGIPPYECMSRHYSEGSFIKGGSTLTLEGSFYSENNDPIDLWGGVYATASISYYYYVDGLLSMEHRNFNASWIPYPGEDSWEVPFSLSLNMPDNVSSAAFSLNMGPYAHLTSWSFSPTLIVSAYRVNQSSSCITGDILEALFVAIPPEGGYIEARNLQTNQIYLSSGIANPSASWDENGAYAIACPNGTYQVWAWAPCYISQTKNDVVVIAPQNTTGVNFRLAPSFRQINFIVVDTQGNPVQGAKVSLTEIPSGFNLSSTTNSEGKTWLLLEGTVAPSSANYTLDITQGTQTASTITFVAIPLCLNMADPGQTLLVQTDQIVWDSSASTSSPTIRVILAGSTSQGVLLNTVVTLNSSTPSRNYFYSLTGGDTVSMNVSVSGDPADLRVYSSAGSQVYSQTGIDTDPLYEWKVPYDDVFEFVIETTGTQSLVALTIEVSPAGNPPGGFDYLPLIIIAIVAVVVVLGVFFLVRSRKASVPPPPPPPSPQNLPPP